MIFGSKSKYVFIGDDKTISCKIDGFQLPVKVGDTFYIKVTVDQKRSKFLNIRTMRNFDIRLMLNNPVPYMNKDTGYVLDKEVMWLWMEEKDFRRQFVTIKKYREMRLKKLLE